MDELADLVHDARLVRLEGADEMPAERVGVERVLALQVLGSVLTCDRDPGVGEDAHVLGRHVLRRRDDGDAGAGLGADGVVRRPDGVGVHVSSRAARSSSQSRVLRAGSSTTSARRSRKTRPRLGPSAKPIARRSSPVTARSDRWCGCARSCVSSRRSSSTRSSSVGGDVFRGEVGELVVDQVVGERIAVLGQEAPGIAGIGRLVELEAVVGDDPDDVMPNPGRVAEALQDLVGERSADARMVVVVALDEWLAEIVKQSGEPHLEPRAVVCGDLGDREQVLVERQRLPVGAEREADRRGEFRDHAREHARVAGEVERAGRLPAQQELGELALGVGLDPTSDPLRGDMGETGSGGVHLSQGLGCEVEVELGDKPKGADEAEWVVLEARRADGAQPAALEVIDATERVERGCRPRAGGPWR